MAKFYLEKISRGKHYYYKVKSASGNTLKDLENSGKKLFDSYKDALEYAVNLKKGD